MFNAGVEVGGKLAGSVSTEQTSVDWESGENYNHNDILCYGNYSGPWLF